jgi:low affinity Fe/Cu permease
MWLISLYLLVHFIGLIDLSPVVYIYTLALVVIMLGIPRLSKVNLVWQLVVPVGVYLAIKLLVGVPLLGSNFLATVIESAAILSTTLMLIWVREPVIEFESAVVNLTFNKTDKVVETASEGQSILYREVRRARNHQRPLSIMAIAVDEASIQGSVDRMVKEAQQSIIRQYTLANVSRTLCDKLEDCDIVVQTNSHFVVVLPETKPEDLPGLIERLQKQITENVGVAIKVGTASLPQDSFTLDGLLEKATLELEGSMDTELFIEPEQLFIKHKPADRSS